MAKNNRLPHIFLEDRAQTEKYTYPGRRVPTSGLPKRDRTSHADRLLDSLRRARTEARNREAEVTVWAVPAKKGVHST